MKRLDAWLGLAACALVGWFYTWTVLSTGEPWTFGEEQRDYYNLLIDGYLDGQLHMKVEVPPALLALENPYDPKLRPAGLGLHDASFFQGRYYVYFGAAPMIVLMLPFRVLTGMDLPLVVAVLAYVYAAFLGSAALLFAIKRLYFSDAPAVVTTGLLLVLGFAGVNATLLRRPDMWELPIAGAACFAILALVCVWQSLHASRARGWWYSAAGTCVGLAIASRPTYLFAAPLLVPPLLLWWRAERRVPWRAVVHGAVPLAIIGAVLAWHNYARFGDPLQFGQAYQFSLDYESKLPHFRAAYLPFNLRAHFFSTADWAEYFPFIQPADLGPAPAGYTIHRGDIFGLLGNFPITWLALLTPLAVYRRAPGEPRLLATVLASVALLFAGNAGLLLFFFSALLRYQMEFAPALLLLACVGVLAVERWAAQRTRARFVRAAWLGLAAYSAGFGILASLQYEGLLPQQNPEAARAIALRANRISAIVERIAGIRHGPVEMIVQFPGDQVTGRETLLTSGEAPALDRVLIEYGADGRVRFGIAPHAAAERWSRALGIDRTIPHRLRIALGSLYPPVEHPGFARLPVEQARRAVRELRIEVDRELVLVGHHRNVGVVDRRVAIGADAPVAAGERPFRGQIQSVSRLGFGGGTPAPVGPFVRCRFSPGAGMNGRCEPLVGFGEGASAAVLTVTRLSEDQVRFGWLGPAGAKRESDPIALRSSGATELCLGFEPQPEAGYRRLLMSVDGVLMWSMPVAWSQRDDAAVVVGQTRRPGGQEECAPVFSGKVWSFEHASDGRDPLGQEGDWVRLRVRFPTDRAGTREPLVVTGRIGAADLVVVEYVDARAVRFGLDHWGAPMQWSEPCLVNLAEAHAIEVRHPSLHHVKDALLEPHELAGELSVILDGTAVWSTNGSFYPAEPEELELGRNSVGGTSCGTEFTGVLMEAMRRPRE